MRRLCIENSKIGNIHLSPNSAESVQVFYRIQLDWSHLAFILYISLNPVDFLSLALLWCCWSISSRFSFHLFTCFPSVGFFVIGIHQLMQHYKRGYVRHFELLNESIFELWNFRRNMLDVGWNIFNESVRTRISSFMQHPKFRPKFHSTRILNVGFNFGCICVGLKAIADVSRGGSFESCFAWVGCKWLTLGKEGFAWGTRGRKLCRLAIKWTSSKTVVRVPSNDCFKSIASHK